MANRDLGSLTKETPLSKLDGTIEAIRPGMQYAALLNFAREHTHNTAPGLIRKRFILVDDDDTIIYDRFLQLVSEHGIKAPIVRKTMYFVWAYRDERFRNFICERVADRRGKWRTTQLLNKNNAIFFEKWFVPKSAQKARSNIEFFLVGAGIFDPQQRSVSLGMDDGWLTDAAIIAAQYEKNSSDRQQLVHDPKGFLIQKGWTGLINLTPEELQNIDLPETNDPSPLEDDTISISPVVKSRGQSWNRELPKSSGKQSTSATVDLVLRERASKAHHTLEKSLAEAARALGCDPKYNEHIDMYFDTTNGVVLAEIKSANGKNFHSQIRKGISQLFEYRFIYRDLIGPSVILLLITETPPTSSKTWLVEYLESLKITLAWQDSKSLKFFTSRSIPRALKGIVHSLKE